MEENGDNQDRGAAERPLDGCLDQVYSELKRMADGLFRNQRTGHTLQPTALVHEAFLRMAEQDDSLARDRTRFLATAALAMRQILVDHARRKTAAKRGGGVARVTLQEGDARLERGDVDVLELDDALRRLAELDERKARVVELRLFAGLTIAEAAEVLGVSHMTISSDWRMASAWLASDLK